MTAAEREQRHHSMSSMEEHYALTWLRDHAPAVFDRAAAHVEKIRRLDETGTRGEVRHGA